MIREMVGTIVSNANTGADGIFVVDRWQPVYTSGLAGSVQCGLTMRASRVVPTGNAAKPRAWGALACAYLGQPAL